MPARHGENICGEYQIVHQRHLCSEMSNGNAQQLMRAAETAYPDYIWEVKAAGKFFIVEERKRTNRKAGLPAGCCLDWFRVSSDEKTSGPESDATDYGDPADSAVAKPEIDNAFLMTSEH